MRLLVLGGTVFVGRAVAEAAVAAGAEVTVLHRGRSGRPPAGVRVCHGDRGRADGLAALAGRGFDAVVDTAREDVAMVSRAAGQLAGRVGHYAYLSSVSVYADLSRVGLREDDPLREHPEGSDPEDRYGARKVACERAVEAALPGRALLVRPGLVVGPGDPTDRFSYWPARVARGGEVLAPGRPDRPVQFVDVRDLARWVVGALGAGVTGTYNVVGPADPLTMGTLLDGCRALTGSGAELTWVDEAFLLARGVQPYQDLPLWVPDEPRLAGFGRISAARAVAAGLSFRPPADTIRDTLAWLARRPRDRAWRAGLSRQREAELLAEWRRG